MKKKCRADGTSALNAAFTDNTFSFGSPMAITPLQKISLDILQGKITEKAFLPDTPPVTPPVTPPNIPPVTPPINPPEIRGEEYAKTTLLDSARDIWEENKTVIIVVAAVIIILLFMKKE